MFLLWCHHMWHIFCQLHDLICMWRVKKYILKPESNVCFPLLGISYSTINSSLSMSSLCNHWPWRTTASNERAKGLGTRWNTNTQTYLKLFDYQSTSPTLEGKNKKDVWNHATFQKRKKKQALSYFLASTWQNWMKRRERGRVGIWQFQAEGRGLKALALSSLPVVLQGQSLSVTEHHVVWAHLDFSYSVLTPFHPTTPRSISLPWCSCFNWPSI